MTRPSPKQVALARQVLSADRKARKAERPAKTPAKAVKPTRGREIDRDYKGFIAGLPCIATLAREGREAYGVHVAHVRHSYPHEGWRNPGLQRKPDDWRTLPLLPDEHRRQHDMNEAEFYRDLGVYPPDLCRDLRAAYPDHEAALAVLRQHAGRTLA